MRSCGAACLLMIVGCQAAPPVAPREAIPPPFTANGATISFSDERHEWERQQITGPIAVYRLGRVSPNPWSQLAKETEAIVEAMPEKPVRVEVFVTSFRLIRKEDKKSIHDPSDNVKIGKQSVAGLNGPLNKFMDTKNILIKRTNAAFNSRITMAGNDSGYNARNKRTTGKRNDHGLYWF